MFLKNLTFIIFSFTMFVKFILMTLLITLNFISLSLSDILIIWFIMEITNFLFISYMSFTINNKKMIFLYFLIQFISSSLLILLFTINYMSYFNSNMFMNLLIYMSLFFKMSIPPFHFWLILMSSYLTWDSLFLMLTIQKIIPFYMLYFFSIFNNYFYIIYFIILLSSIIPPMMMMNLLNMKKLISYSSINQLSWMLILIYFKNFLWFNYFMFYSFILLITLMSLNMFKIYYNFLYKFKNLNMNFMIMFFIMNLASLPPFSFFIMKWYSVFFFIYNSNLFLIFMIMIISSFFMVYIYINMMFKSLFMWTSNPKMIILSLKYNNYSSPLLFSLSLIISLMILIM